MAPPQGLQPDGNAIPYHFNFPLSFRCHEFCGTFVRISVSDASQTEKDYTQIEARQG